MSSLQQKETGKDKKREFQYNEGINIRRENRMEIMKIVNEKVRDNTDKRTFIKQLKHFFIKSHIAKICNCMKNKCILAIFFFFFLLCLIMEKFYMNL